MTDFGINKGPDHNKNMGANFNSERQNSAKKDDGNASRQEQAASGDPYAESRLNPDQVFQHLNFTGKMNLSDVENVSINKSVAAFEALLTPEQHDRIGRQIETEFQDLFGFNPGPAFLENAVNTYIDNNIIGMPVIKL